jgi:glutamine synthetase
MAEAETIENVLASIETHDIEWVRFIWCDNANLIRAKAVHTGFLDDFLAGDGVGIAGAQQALPVMADAPAAGSGLTPAGEVHMRADWSTFTPLPYAPGHARVFTDIYEGDEPWGHCPRAVLRRAIEQAAARGYRIMAAYENEFYLLRPHEGGFAPSDPTNFAQTYALDRNVHLLNAIGQALKAQGLLPEMIYAESGPGQFEIPTRYAEALEAADNQVAFRETVRAVAYNHGLIASFVPKIFAERTGSGAHLHLSLWQNGNNATNDPAQPTALSSEALAFVAGILHHLPALMAITTSSPNSYRRILPRFWSGAFTCWGYGNREAAVRVPQLPAGRAVSNVELKAIDATSNPYLALGATIAAGLDGIKNDMSPGDPVQMDPADMPEDEREARGVHRLPGSLSDAIAAFEGDAVVQDALGPELTQSFLAVRRAEWEDLSLEEQVELLLERY